VGDLHSRLTAPHLFREQLLRPRLILEINIRKRPSVADEQTRRARRISSPKILRTSLD
jgi:hypothetical protein